MATHYLPDESPHYRWDTANAPRLTIDPGDTVVLWTRDVSGNQIRRDSDASALAVLDRDRVYPLNGPIGVEGAAPGDTLKIQVLDIGTQGWGWAAISPIGLLTEDFPDPYLRTFDLSNGSHAYLREDIAIPIDPFFGTMGVCPAGATEQSCVQPGSFGGNMDIRQLGRGSELHLPVQVDGALFSCGDAHAAQGDGEVSGTGIEAPMYAALRFTLEKGRSIPAPQYRTPAATPPAIGAGPWFATTGIGPDLYVASQDAVRAMIDHMGRTYDLSPQDAYILCSLAVDLRISEIVDGGQYVVSALLPEGLFTT